MKSCTAARIKDNEFIDLLDYIWTCILEHRKLSFFGLFALLAMPKPLMPQRFDDLILHQNDKRQSVIIWTAEAIGRYIGISADFVTDTLAHVDGSLVSKVGSVIAKRGRRAWRSLIENHFLSNNPTRCAPQIPQQGIKSDCSRLDWPMARSGSFQSLTAAPKTKGYEAVSHLKKVHGLYGNKSIAIRYIWNWWPVNNA